jgi:hypothetical protein
MYGSTFSLALTLDWGGGKEHSPPDLPPGKIWERNRTCPDGRGKSRSPVGFNPRIDQPVESIYTAYATSFTEQYDLNVWYV